MNVPLPVRRRNRSDWLRLACEIKGSDSNEDKSEDPEAGVAHVIPPLRLQTDDDSHCLY
jgi:hypothetical protein